MAKGTTLNWNEVKLQVPKVVGNVVRQWSPDGTVTEILSPGGYSGEEQGVDGE
jgi:hypothetical protein